MTDNLRDNGAFGVRVLSGFSGESTYNDVLQYRTARLNTSDKVVKFKLSQVGSRAGCAPSTCGALHVGDYVSSATRTGSCSVTGPVSARVLQNPLTALKGRGVTQVPR